MILGEMLGSVTVNTCFVWRLDLKQSCPIKRSEKYGAKGRDLNTNTQTFRLCGKVTMETNLNYPWPIDGCPKLPFSDCPVLRWARCFQLTLMPWQDGHQRGINSFSPRPEHVHSKETFEGYHLCCFEYIGISRFAAVNKISQEDNEKTGFSWSPKPAYYLKVPTTSTIPGDFWVRFFIPSSLAPWLNGAWKPLSEMILAVLDYLKLY